MPPNGENDSILLGRGTDEEAKMCQKYDTANSPATGQAGTHVPASMISTPLYTGITIEGQAQNFMNALTGKTGVPPKIISFEEERGFDEQLKAPLKANAQQIHEKNREWWNKLSLDNFYPLGEANPYDYPNSYANLAFYLQRLFNNSNTTQAIFKRQMNEDGIFARETLAVLYQLAVKFPSNEKELIKVPKLHKLVNNMSVQLHILKDSIDTAVLIRDLEEHLLTVIIKPKTIVKWNYESNIISLINFFRYNYTRKGPVEQGVHFDTSFFPIIRFLSQNDSEAEHIAEMLTLEQKLEMLSTLFGKQNIQASAVYFEAKRTFTHYEDLQEVNPKKQYKEFSLNFILTNAEFVDEVEPVLKIKFPDWGLVSQTREKSKQFGQSNEDDKNKNNKKVKQKEPDLIFLALFHYLPKINNKNKYAAKALIDQYVMEKNVEQQAAMNLIRELEADVVQRKALDADIRDYKIMMDVLTFRVASKGLPSAEVKLLMEKAETTYFLTVRLDAKADIFILTYRQIVEANNKAVYNDSYPIKIGDFEPPPQSPIRVDDSNLKAEREEEFIHVKLFGLYQPWNERRFTFFEPVRIDIGVLDPDVGTATEFYRTFFGNKVWYVETQWYLSDSLPDVLPEIRKNLDRALALKGLDIIITSLSLALTFAGSLLKITGTTLIGGIGAKAIVPLSRSLLKAVFWFILSEYLVAKMMEFDKKISVDKDNYDDNDRALWHTFKIGLFILGGAMVIRQAWKGLKFAGSRLFASSLTELELELLKKGTMKPLPAAATMTRMLSAKTAALTVSKQWAKEALALTASTLRDLTEEAVTRLKQLPPWGLNLIKEMKDEVIRKLFGCASFCTVDLTAIKNGLIEVVVNKLKIDNIKGIMVAEKEMLKNLSFEAWDRIIKYAVRNSNYYSVKGKIAEELFFMKPEFRNILDEAIVAAERTGIKPVDLEFVNYIKGWAPTTTKAVQKGVWAELTDGMIVGIKRNANGQGKDELHILAIFESKSPSNIDNLAKGKWDYIGQMGKDFERIRQNSIKIIINGEEKEFGQGAVKISRRTTQWVGVVPPGYQLSNELLKRLKAALPDVRFIEGPVRNEVLNDLAKALKGVINYQPK